MLNLSPALAFGDGRNAHSDEMSIEDGLPLHGQRRMAVILLFPDCVTLAIEARVLQRTLQRPSKGAHLPYLSTLKPPVESLQALPYRFRSDEIVGHRFLISFGNALVLDQPLRTVNRVSPLSAFRKAVF